MFLALRILPTHLLRFLFLLTSRNSLPCIYTHIHISLPCFPAWVVIDVEHGRCSSENQARVRYLHRHSTTTTPPQHGPYMVLAIRFPTLIPFSTKSFVCLFSLSSFAIFCHFSPFSFSFLSPSQPATSCGPPRAPSSSHP